MLETTTQGNDGMTNLKNLLSINAQLRAQTVDNNWFVFDHENGFIVTHLAYEEQSIHDTWDVAMIVCGIIEQYNSDHHAEYEVRSDHILITY